MTKPKQIWRCHKCSCYGKAIPRAHPRSKLCAWCAGELAAAGLIWCGGCKQGKPPSDMSNAYICRACNKARNTAWRAAHLAYVAEHNRAWREAHTDERIAQTRAYYHANRERLLRDKKSYYAANREQIKAYQRERRRLGLISPASRDKMRARHRRMRRVYSQNEKLARARRWLLSLRGDT